MTGATLPIHLAFWQRTAIAVLVLVALLPALAIAAAAGARVLTARARRAVGPADVGPAGLLQPVADLGRSLQSEDLLPAGGSRLLADVGLAAMVLAVFGLACLVPVGPQQFAAAPRLGLVLALLWLGVAGGASRAANGVLPSRAGAVRAVAALSVVAVAGASVAVASGSAAVTELVRWQGDGALFGWNGVALPGVVVHPLGFVAFLGGLAALVSAGPFRPGSREDPLAGTSGLRRWHWAWLRWAGLIAGCATAATWFLGGWALPGHPSSSTMAVFGPVLLGAKTAVLVAAVASLEVAWPRLGDAHRAVVVRWLLLFAVADLVATLIVKTSW